MILKKEQMSELEKDNKRITVKNILSYIEGNTNWLLDVFDLYPEYKKEQVMWRLQICKMDCVKENACIYCGCPPERKAFVDTSCNGGDRFPDMMDKETWEKYKEQNNLNIDEYSF